MIEAASTEARRIDVSDPLLPRALLGVANAVLLVNPSQVWDATFDAVKAANSVEGFTGEDGEIVYRFEGKGHRSISSSDVADFDVQGIFQQLANQDYDRAVELARGFQGEGPRAVATIAIARAVLEKKKPAVAVKNYEEGGLWSWAWGLWKSSSKTKVQKPKTIFTNRYSSAS